MAAADAGPHLGVLGPMLGLILLRARADAGPQFGVLGHMLGLRSVGWGLCRASFCLCLGFCRASFFGVRWDLCWASLLCAGAYAGHQYCGLGLMLGLMFVD